MIFYHVLSHRKVFKPMPKFRETIHQAHVSRLINAEEFCDLYKPENPDLPHTSYEYLGLDKMKDDVK